MKSDTLPKKKYQWLFSANFPGANLSQRVVKIQERPTLHIVEKENSDGSFRIEKQSWKPFVTTFYDAGNEEMKDLYTLLGSFYKFGAELFKTEDPAEELDKIKDSLGTGRIIMCDGDKQLEEWTFNGLWPHSVNFGDLCYSSSPEIDIEVTWRFKECGYRNLLAVPLNSA